MKKILSLIFIFQLILSPMPSMAADNSTSTSTETETDDEAEANAAEASVDELFNKAEEQVNADDAGATSHGDQARQGKGESDWGSTFWFRQSLAIFTTAIGSGTMFCANLWTNPSLVAFQAGSVLYLAQEILSAKDMNKELETDFQDLRMDEEKLKKNMGNGLQKSTLEKLRAKEIVLRDTAERKKNWLYAVGGIFSLATGSALFEAFKISDAGNGGCLLSGAFAPIEEVSRLQIGAVASAWALGGILASDNRIIGGSANDLGTALVTAAAAFLPWGVPKTLTVIDTPIPRMITLGVLSGLMWWLAEKYDSSMEVARDNVAKIQKVIDAFPPDESGDTNPETTGATAGGASPGSSDYTAGGSGGGSTGGRPGGSSGTSQNQNNCFSMGSVNPLKLSSDCSNPLSSRLGEIDMGNVPLLNNVADLARDMVNAAGRGDFAKADSLASKIASNAGGLRKLNKDLEKKLNEHLRKNKKPEIDFKAERKKTFAMLQDKLMESTNGKLGPLLGSTSGAGALNNLDQLKKDKKIDPDSRFISRKAPEGKASGAESLSGFSSYGKNSSESKVLESSLHKTGDQLKKYEVDVADISNSKEASIFAIISNRYVMSYDRIMKKRKN